MGRERCSSPLLPNNDSIALSIKNVGFESKSMENFSLLSRKYGRKFHFEPKKPHINLQFSFLSPPPKKSRHQSKV